MHTRYTSSFFAFCVFGKKGIRERRQLLINSVDIHATLNQNKISDDARPKLSYWIFLSVLLEYTYGIGESMKQVALITGYFPLTDSQIVWIYENMKNIIPYSLIWTNPSND
ncbi:MAG: hypothetical protein WA941_01770 [Nitrososphaeraceae archaeon]